MPWKFLGFGADKRHITIEYVKGDGSCVLPVGFSAHQVKGGVVVKAVSRSTNARACSDALVIGHALITLPVVVGGSVRLLHAPVDREWASTHYFD